MGEWCLRRHLLKGWGGNKKGRCLVGGVLDNFGGAALPGSCAGES